jgi:hypothetical protein
MAKLVPDNDGLRERAALEIAAMPTPVVDLLGKDPVEARYKQLKRTLEQEVLSVVRNIRPDQKQQKAAQIEALLKRLEVAGDTDVTADELRKCFPATKPFKESSFDALPSREFKQKAVFLILLHEIAGIREQLRKTIIDVLQRVYAVYLQIESSSQKNSIYEFLKQHLDEQNINFHADLDDAGILCKVIFPTAVPKTINLYYRSLQYGLHLQADPAKFSEVIKAEGGLEHARRQMAKLKPKVTIDLSKRITISEASIAKNALPKALPKPIATITFTDEEWRRVFFTNDNYVIFLGSVAGAKNTVTVHASLPVDDKLDELIFNKLASSMKHTKAYKDEEAVFVKHRDERIKKIQDDANALNLQLDTSIKDEKLAKQLRNQLHPKQPKSNKPKAAKKTAA